MSRVSTAGVACLLACIAAAAEQTSPLPVDWSADDGKRVEELTARGKRLEGTQVIVWTPAAFPDAEHRALVDRLDRGVSALRVVVGSHPWQSVGQRKITYYISADRFVSHGSGQAAVFIPLERVEDGFAPYLHEAMHELLATPETRANVQAERLQRIKLRPLWLAEGLPDYVAQTVAASTGLAEGDVFDTGGLDGVDRTCSSRLAGPAGAQVLDFIGAPGRPDALFTAERHTVAPTFYSCSFSFTKFVVERIGLPETIGLVPLIDKGAVHERIEMLTNRRMSDLRSDWLRHIGHR
jgi:hypothetical protein